MTNISLFPRFISNKNRLTRLSSVEKIIYWTIVLTPLWWLLGIQPIFYPAVLVVLLVKNFGIEKVINYPLPICIWSWFLMSMIMIWTAMVGIFSSSLETRYIFAALVTFLKGYFLIFSCLVIPYWSLVRVKVVTRAVSWLSSIFLLSLSFQIIQLIMGFNEPFSPPWARFFPGNPSSFIVDAATFKPFFGVIVPRTTLYYPDPPILGICGLLCFIICLGESCTFLRRTGLVGSFAVLLISQSRLAWICWPIALCIYSIFHNKSMRLGSLWMGSFSALLCVSLGGITIAELLNKPLEIFTSARPSSSADRGFVVQKTLEAWQESPLIGWGVAQGTANWHTYSITLGSFSTYAAVLYLHGLVGFIFFLAALISSFWSLWKLSSQGNLVAQRAFASFLALTIFMEAIPLSWMAVYLWFFFIWMGSILAESSNSANGQKLLCN